MRQSYSSFGRGTAVGLLWACFLAGCQQAPPRPTPAGSVLSASQESGPRLEGRQVADVQVALGRVQERRGEVGQAQATYLEALKHDASRADACERLGVLCDRQGKAAEAREWYEKARAAQKANPDLLCNLGYSHYIQSRWAEAEDALRQAIALSPDHRRAHNNLGLVLAHTGREQEALAEFRKAGCTEAESRSNLAFALTLKRRWPEARACYERALAADPSSAPARNGLRQVNALLTKGDIPPPVARGDAGATALNQGGGLGGSPSGAAERKATRGGAGGGTST